MKIIIIGKRDQMGTTPAIRVKGMSQVRYNFLWDKEIRHYAYEPKDQKEVNDIFRTQGKLYKTMFFSVWLDEEPEAKIVKEGMIKQSLAEAEVESTKPKPKAKGQKSKAAKQPVEKALLEA
jgi:hypothetical protein